MVKAQWLEQRDVAYRLSWLISTVFFSRLLFANEHEQLAVKPKTSVIHVEAFLPSPPPCGMCTTACDAPYLNVHQPFHSAPQSKYGKFPGDWLFMKYITPLWGENVGVWRYTPVTEWTTTWGDGTNISPWTTFPGSFGGDGRYTDACVWAGLGQWGRCRFSWYSTWKKMENRERSPGCDLFDVERKTCLERVT